MGLTLLSPAGRLLHVASHVTAFYGAGLDFPQRAASRVSTSFTSRRHFFLPKLSKADKRAKISATEAERRRKVAMAEIREIERDQKRGALIPVAEVRKGLAERFSALKDRILMLPDRLGARAAHRSEAEVRAILRDELEDCLRGIHAEEHGL
jgi:hypothetical protein